MWKNARPDHVCRNPPSKLIHSYYTIMSEFGIFSGAVAQRPHTHTSPAHIYPDKNGQNDYISFAIANVSHLKSR